MNLPVLAGQAILVVEDEPLVALEIAQCLRGAGASVIVAHCLREAMPLAEHADLSAAVLDFGLRDGDTGGLCQRLNARHIPFVLYSGYLHVDLACSKGVQLSKPASAEELISAVGGLVH